MRIVVWNIHQALQTTRKREALDGLRPDVAVVPESSKDFTSPAGCSVWVGQNKNKGLGVLSYGDYRVNLHPAYDPVITWAAPVQVTGPQSFFLLAIWNMKPYRFIYDALDRYRHLLRAGPAVVAGDFNLMELKGFPNLWEDSAYRKDSKYYLRGLPLVSAYHKYFRESPYHETRSTLYFQYKNVKGYIYPWDFCFIPEAWSERLRSVRIGTYHKWVEFPNRLSDHVPVTVDVAPV